MTEEDARSDDREIRLEIEEIGGRDPEAGETARGGNDQTHAARRRLALAVPQPMQMHAADGAEAEERRETARAGFDAGRAELHECEERAEAGETVVVRAHLSWCDGRQEIPTCAFADSRYT